MPSMTSSPPRPLMTMRSLVGSKLVIVVSVARPDTVTTPLLLVMVITSSPLVALMMIVSGWPSPERRWQPRSMATCLTSVPVRSLTVMVSAPPRALSWIRSTPLRSMVMLATSRNSVARLPLAEMVDVLVDVGAVEQQRVGAGLALDRVAAVAWVPDEGVVAGAEERDVVAATADDQVVAGAAGDGVVAVAAVDHEVDHARLERRSVDRVVAGETVDGERVVGTFGVRDRHLRGEPVHRHRAAAAGDLDGIVARRCR